MVEGWRNGVPFRFGVLVAVGALAIGVTTGWFGGRWYEARPEHARGVAAVTANGDGTFQSEDGPAVYIHQGVAWRGPHNRIGTGDPPCIEPPSPGEGALSYEVDVTYRWESTPDSSYPVVLWVDCATARPPR